MPGELVVNRDHARDKSSKGFEDWAQTLGDNVVTAAVMDRLLHKCEIFNIDGGSWRLSNQQTILKNLLKGGVDHA